MKYDFLDNGILNNKCELYKELVKALGKKEFFNIADKSKLIKSDEIIKKAEPSTNEEKPLRMSLIKSEEVENSNKSKSEKIDSNDMADKSEKTEEIRLLITREGKIDAKTRLAHLLKENGHDLESFSGLEYKASKKGTLLHSCKLYIKLHKVFPNYEFIMN